MSEETTRYDAANTEPERFRARRLARALGADPFTADALVDAIIAATVEEIERRLVAIEARQLNEDRHTLALMAATLAAGDTRGGDVQVYVAVARALLSAVEDALGIVRLTDEVPLAALGEGHGR